jgi:O-acetyl-ADP-ribose deacetylase (regulator of RNase III)
MKIYLLDRNSKVCYWWKFFFKDCQDVEVVCEDFAIFMDSHKVEAIVSPANSYGLMDGGYDLAISEYFGDGLAKKVQKYIVDNLYGEQPVGTSIIVDIDNKQKLIHTPSMRVPSPIKDPLVVYNCMRTCLMTALDNNIESIVIPAFGGDCGDMNYSVIAEMMYNAYMQVFNPPKEINWDYALNWRPEMKY